MVLGNKIIKRAWTNAKLKLYLTTCGIIVFLFVTVYLLSDPWLIDINPIVISKGNLQYGQEKDKKDYKNGIKNSSDYLSPFESDKFQLKLDHCKILKVPLVSASLDQTWRVPKEHTCTDGFSFMDNDGNLILKHFEKDCCYEAITRPDSMVEDSFQISPTCIPIKSKSSKINEEFFRVKCLSKGIWASFDKLKEPMYEYHATAKLTDRIQNKIKFWETHDPSGEKRPPNVLMLAIDATSRTHFYRSLPKTVDQLNEMEFLDFKGHHILGEPTFPNALPILMGESAEKFWQTNKTSWTTQWDSYPFIWKEFDKLNYVTMFMEDEQKFGTYTYGGQTGFRHQPTDVYPRPFLLAREHYRANKGDRTPCFGKRTMPDYLLSYLNRFLNNIQGTPLFSLNWLTWPQHDFMERLSELDSPLSSFFSKLSTNTQILENTVIILFSDHSSWNSPYSETPEGRLERRLPFLFIRYPKRLQETLKGKRQLSNLMSNRYRLTTHYDTHKTLLHLSNMAAKYLNKTVPTKSKGVSLLAGKISRKRTCHRANIGSFICACDLMLPITTINQEVKSSEDKTLHDLLKLPPPIRNARPFFKDFL